MRFSIDGFVFDTISDDSSEVILGQINKSAVTLNIPGVVEHLGKKYTVVCIEPFWEERTWVGQDPDDRRRKKTFHGTYKVHLITGTVYNVIIPDTVYDIGDSAFCRAKCIKSITIPNSVKKIGYCAFENCESLTSVNIPNSVKEIGPSAFSGCISLESVNIPDSVETVKSSLFSCCSKLKKIEIGNRVKVIPWDWFRECMALEKITIPSGVEIIEGGAFDGCNNLKEVDILNEKEGIIVKCTFPEKVKVNYLGKQVVKKTASTKEKKTSPAQKQTAKKETPALKAETKPATKTTPASGGKGSMTVTIAAATTVADLSEQFKATFGGTLRIYQGNKRPAGSDKVASIAAKTGTLKCDSTMTVEAFAKAMLDTFGLKVKVASCDDWVVALDALTLEQVGKIKKNATKADMEKML